MPSNREQAPDWGVEVVAIPDQPGTLDGLDETVEFLDAQRRPVPDRPDPRADRLRLRGLPRPLSRGPPTLSRGGDDDGHRQPDRADRRRLGRGQHDPRRVLPGAGDPERLDDGGHQLGAVVGSRARPRAAARASCRDASDPAQARRAAAGRAARPQGRRVRRREPGRDPAADPRPELADLRRGWPDPCHEQSESPARFRPVPSLRADGGQRPVARVLSRLRDDEGQNRLDSEQDLSPGSSFRLGFPDGARGQSRRRREAAGDRPADVSDRSPPQDGGTEDTGEVRA